MDKFDLQRALDGESVCTKDGRDVTQLTCFKDVLQRDCVYGVVSNEIKCWAIDGSYFLNASDSELDLFMKPKENAIWVNLYKSKEGHLYTTGVEYPNEESAKESADEFGYLRTIKIVE
jgi:hypothetical protein